VKFCLESNFDLKSASLEADSFLLLAFYKGSSSPLFFEFKVSSKGKWVALIGNDL